MVVAIASLHFGFPRDLPDGIAETDLNTQEISSV